MEQLQGCGDHGLSVSVDDIMGNLVEEFILVSFLKNIHSRRESRTTP